MSQRVLLMLALVLAEIVSAVESTMIFAALRVFNREFGNPVAVGWTITAFLLVAAGSAAVCARLGDMYGRRKLLLWSIALAGLGSVISAMSTGAAGVIAGRAVQGLAGAVLPLCFGLVRQHLPAPQVQLGVGIVAAAAFVSGGLAIVAGGVVIDHLHWHWIFVVGAGTALLAWPAVWLWVPRDNVQQTRQAIDWPGALLLLPALTALLLVPTQAKSWGWVDARTLALAVAGAALLALWGRHEWRCAAPLIDVRLLGRRQLALANAAMVLLALGPMQSGFVLSSLLQQPAATGIGLGLSATTAGAVQALPMVLAVFIGPLAGWLAQRSGARAPAMWACAVLLVGWSGVALWQGTVPWVGMMAALCGTGLALAYAAAPMLIVEAAPPDRTSESTGVSSVLRYLFNAVGSQLVALMLASSTVSDAALGPGRFPSATAFELTLLVISGLAGLALLAAWALPRPGAKPMRAAQGAMT
ncbi:MFS transporter [Aquabacterium sp.]|uniref:MFS transporter n=1 Tax=Aquabacterium sp. TaxID=1872578 RepID=UPI002BF31A1C|nr:MFS transporter [Aquabacterium sp.]HSW04935.1 MFS transporter [Aquabacterium sp.]